MNDSAPQFALRELRQRFSSRMVLGVLAALTAVIAISGPFNTLDLMPLPTRLAYWAFVTPATYGAGLLGSAFVQGLLSGRAMPLWRALILRSLGSTLPVTVLLVGFHLALGIHLPIGAEVPASVRAVLVICLAIEVISELAANQMPATQPKSAPPQTPALLDRLPLEKRGTLLCISAGDHYIKVTTTKGRHLVLMRLSDAIAQTAPTVGLQIHRWHRVAMAYVKQAVRVGNGASLTLTDGKQLPIARTRMPAAVAAGLFERNG